VFRPTRRLVFAAALLAACGGGDLVLPAANAPATLQIVEGDGQSGRVGTALDNPIVALVADQSGRPVVDATVSFAFTDSTGATVKPGAAQTGADGQAAFEVTLGQRVGAVAAQLSVATGGAAPPLNAPISLNALPADANGLAPISGDGQSAPVGSALPDPLVVQATDAFGNPIAGVTVSWTADGGSVSEASTTTGADGLASVNLTLGPAAGTQHASASAEGLAGSPVVFTETATAGAATTLELVSGDNQSALVGTALANPLVVRAHDADGNPVPNLAVTWVVPQGGGQLAPTTTLTGDDGTASTRWTLGTTPGQSIATAVVSGVGTVTFHATANPGTPPGMTLETAPPGNVVRGVPFAVAPVIQLRDPDGGLRRLGGVGVTVTLQPGGASLAGTRSQTTDANGRASFPGLAIIGPPAGYTLAFTASGYSGVTSGTITVSRAPTVTTIVSDEPDPSVAGTDVTVHYTVTSPGGTPDGNVRVVSDGGPSCSGTVADGGCTLAPTAPGTHNLTATYAGSAEFEGSADTKNHTVAAPVASVLALITQPAATAVEGAPFSRQPVVQLRDGNGADVKTSGIAVHAAVTSGGASLGGTTMQTTDANGRATFTDLSISGATGSQTITFSADGFTSIQSAPIDVQAPGPVATTTSITSDEPDPSDPGQAVTIRFSVTAASGTPTGIVTVSASGSETCSGSLAPAGSGAQGSCALTLTTSGDRTITASYAGEAGFAGSSGTTSHHVNTPPPPPAQPDPTTSTIQVKDGTIGLGKSTDVKVVVRDGSGNPLKGIAVTLSASGSGNTISPASATTKDGGDAGFKFSSTVAEAKTLTAVAGGVTLTAQPTVTVTPATTTTKITSETPDPSAPGTAVTVSYQVQSDAGSPTGTVIVSASDAASTPCTSSAPTGSCQITLTTAGPVTLTATYAGDGNFTGSAGQTSHQVQAPPPPKLTLATQPPPSASLSVPLQPQPQVQLQSADGHALAQSGVTVMAQVATGPGSLGGTATATSDGNGLASFADLQINGLAGKYTLSFTADGFASATSQSISAALVPTTTTIVSDEPNPSTVGQPVTVSFSVQAILSTFTGTVTVTSSGGESCNAPVSAGACAITFLAAGDHTLTAAYSGDTVFAPSTSPPVTQGVNDAGTPPAGGT
jgi:large repetitive protein